MKGRALFRDLAAMALCALIGLGLSVPAGAAAAPGGTTLRVAYYPLDGFFEYDAQGAETGYGVDLLNKVSQYTGLQFEYVPAKSWESTKQMLLSGEADLRMPATAPATPSATLSYNSTAILDTYDVLLAKSTRDDLYYQDYDTIRTLTIAVSESFYQVNDVQSYLDSIGVAEDRLLFCSEYNECREKLLSGEADALITNIMDMDGGMKMLARFNSISNYFSMTLDNPLLHVLDDAMLEIKLDEPLFLAELYARWFPERTTVPLTLEESEYVAGIDQLTFAFQPNEGYLSMEEDGVYYGIYTEMAKLICEKLGVGYRAASLPACLAGTESADVYAGFFYDKNYAEQWGFAISAPISDIHYYIIQRKDAAIDPANCTIAAIDKFRYTSDYLEKRYSEARFLFCDTYEECLQAVESGKADMSVINNYIAEYYLGMYQFSDLSGRLSTEYSHMFCFAADGHNELLASLLTKALSAITDEEMTQLYIIGRERRPESSLIQATFYRNPLPATLAVAGIFTLVIAAVMLLLFARKSRERNRALVKALSAKRDFMARMSHDMRTPMNGILGLSYLMEDETDIAAIKGYLPRLRESGQYLLQLINDVLDVNKIESGQLTLHPQRCDEEKLFNSIIAMTEPLMREKGIDFHFEKINIEWQYMLLDEQRVRQIFINLLSNAAKFTPSGGRVDFIMELVYQREDTIRDKFIVRDNGIGVSREFLPHMFEAFQQENRLSNAADGTGLGLPIVKQLVELMGGSITVASEQDRGTEITVFLNFPLAKPPESEQAPAPRRQSENALAGWHILLCEDHPLNAKIIMKLLEKQGCAVDWAENGQAGVALFSASAPGHYDAVLMDIRMPVMDGLAAARAIRALERGDAKSIAIIAVTANAYEMDAEKSAAAGIDAHLAKPIEPQLLLDTLLGFHRD